MFSHRMFLPDMHLRKWVKVIWFLKKYDKEKIAKKTIMPDGCVCITFVLNNSKSNSFCYGNTSSYGIFVSPPAFEKYDIALNDEIYVIDITLHPGAFFHLFGVPVSAMGNQMYNIKEFTNKFDDFILEKLADAQEDVETSLRHVNNFLTQLIYPKLNYSDTTLSLISNIMKHENLDSFYKQQSLSTRQIQRKLKEATGFSPNSIHRISRFYNILTSLKQHSAELSFSDIASQYQFSDQSHLIKEFKSFTGHTPKEFLNHAENYLQYNCKIYC